MAWLRRLDAFPIPMPAIRALVVALGVVGAILEAIFYRPNYRPFVVPICSVQSFGATHDLLSPLDS